MCLLLSLMLSGTERLGAKCFSGQRNKLWQLPANHRIIVLYEMVRVGFGTKCHGKKIHVKYSLHESDGIVFFFQRLQIIPSQTAHSLSLALYLLKLQLCIKLKMNEPLFCERCCCSE